jgi:purine-cytosine permease-like protein
VDNRAAAQGSAPVEDESADEIGQVEARGIHYVPEGDRHSLPRDLAWAMFGPQFGFGNMVFGSLGIVFGLSWWSTFTAVTVGVALGSLIFTGVAIQSPKTGTNNAVSSGAFFGVTGRYLGSLISLFIGLTFFAIVVWTSGQTIIVVFNRLFGTGTGTVALSIAMLIVSLLSFVLAIYGHATLVASFRFVAIASAGVSLLALIVLAGKFQNVQGGSYRLGEYWPTWVLTMVLAASLPITWGRSSATTAATFPPRRRQVRARSPQGSASSRAAGSPRSSPPSRPRRSRIRQPTSRPASRPRRRSGSRSS